ncbi:MAG: ATP-binding cassette domain-containing protein [Fusobacteriaceae bacterium]|jgi:ABC-type microcin C transport system duplicated ATPase subunit YejF|nr:ATP-binding cassette domain-containing protein [Fusobacteriaceae bacterium]
MTRAGKTELDIRNLNVSIDNVDLLKHIDLRIDRDEVVALVGESGSGKTLTSKFILGILPERSVVSFDHFCKTEKVGAVFQNSFTSLNPTVKIGSQLKRLYQSHFGDAGNWKHKVIPLLEKVGIQHIEKFLKKYPHESSGGERQRVAIAGALISDPELLIADEVTTALDLRTKMEVINLFKNIRRETGVTILFITHDLSSITNFADRVYVMYKGEIVEENTCEELFRHQTHPYAQRIIGFANSLWTRDR